MRNLWDRVTTPKALSQEEYSPNEYLLSLLFLDPVCRSIVQFEIEVEDDAG